MLQSPRFGFSRRGASQGPPAGGHGERRVPTHTSHPSRRSRPATGLWLVLSVTLLAGCLTRNTRIDATDPLPPFQDPAERIAAIAGPERTPDGLVRIDIGQIQGAALYVRPPRPHLQRFDSMVLADATIEYRERQVRWSPREETEVRKSFRAKLLEALAEGAAWKLTDRASPTTLLVRPTLLDFESGASGGLGEGSSISFIESGGGAVLGFELFDSATGQALMRYVERYRLPGGTYLGDDIERQQVDRVLGAFARRIGSVLAFQYRVIKDIEEREAAADEDSGE